jgi:NAD(P)-dependent dehydrogenase (short-subunit alcohol dehydrogenase family)
MALSIVTGANRGIGLALTQLLTERGGQVLAACRSTSAELDALNVERVEGIDVTDASSVARLVEATKSRRVDLLVNNAGVLSWDDQLERPDFDGIRRQLEVNALGPLRVTTALKAQLVTGAKVALITSRMGSIEDNSSGGYYGYRMSKAALNMAGKSMAIDLKAAGVAVVILHPGMVKTEMTRGHGQVEPLDAARGLLRRIDELTLETSGAFRHANGEALPW